MAGTSHHAAQPRVPDQCDVEKENAPTEQPALLLPVGERDLLLAGCRWRVLVPSQGGVTQLPGSVTGDYAGKGGQLWADAAHGRSHLSASPTSSSIQPPF